MNYNQLELINHDIQKMRNVESHWQVGKVFYKENNKRFLIKFLNKKSNQKILIRDLYKNNMAVYNKTFTTLFLYKNMFFWCNDIEKNLKFKNILKDVNLSNIDYQKSFLKKKRVLFFLKLKTQSKKISIKINKNISKITNTNLSMHYTLLKRYKTLFNFLFKKIILQRTLKVQILQMKLHLFLFLFLVNCKISKSSNRKKFKFYFFSKKNFHIPISFVVPRQKNILIAQKKFIALVDFINDYAFVKPKKKLNKHQYKLVSQRNDHFNEVQRMKIFHL